MRQLRADSIDQCSLFKRISYDSRGIRASVHGSDSIGIPLRNNDAEGIPYLLNLSHVRSFNTRIHLGGKNFTEICFIMLPIYTSNEKTKSITVTSKLPPPSDGGTVSLAIHEETVFLAER